MAVLRGSTAHGDPLLSREWGCALTAPQPSIAPAPILLFADDALKAARQDGALDEAKAFLAEVLAGGRLPTSEVNTEAAQAGISTAILRRARHDMGIKPDRKSVQGGGGLDLGYNRTAKIDRR
jgi:hypothetical protein